MNERAIISLIGGITTIVLVTCFGFILKKLAEYSREHGFRIPDRDKD